MFIKTVKSIITIKANHNATKTKHLSPEEFGGLDPIAQFNSH